MAQRKTERTVTRGSGTGATKTQKKTGASSVAGRRGSGVRARRERARAVAADLALLRTTLKDVSQSVLTRLDAEILALCDYLEGRGDLEGHVAAPSSASLEAMALQLRSLRVKPLKGRTKDIRRIETLLKMLAGEVPPGT